MGEGPPDVGLSGGPASHLDLQWEEPDTRRGRQRIGSFARLITFGRRGTGLSDAVDRPATLEQQMDDLDAVLDAAGTERVAIIGAWRQVFPRCTRQAIPTEFRRWCSRTFPCLVGSSSTTLAAN